MKHIKESILTFGILLGLLSCSSESEQGERGNTGIPLTLSAYIDNGGTRLATEEGVTTFTTGDVIGLHGTFDESGAVYNKPYTYDGTNWTTTDPFYFQSGGEVTFSAYFPYNASLDAYTNVAPQDFLFAKPSIDYPQTASSSGGGAVTLRFQHAMSKVSFSFTAGDGWMEDSDDLSNITDVQVKGFSAKGTFNTQTGAATATAITASTLDADQTVAFSSGDAYSALVFPQDLGSTEVTLTFTMKKVGFTLSFQPGELKAGTSHQFNVKVSKDAAVVTSASINSWAAEPEVKDLEESLNPSDKFTFGSIRSVNEGEVRQYALAFCDGSFENLTDESGTLDTSPINNLNLFQTENVVGIVYYVGTQANEDDAMLQKDYPYCTHGLICAVSNVKTSKYNYNSGGERMFWQYSGDPDNPGESIEGVYKESKLSTNGATYQALTGSNGKILGYNNTLVLKAYNEYCANGGHESTPNNEKITITADNGTTYNFTYIWNDYIVRPVYALTEEYKVTPPQGCSSWFLGSPTEMVMLWKCKTDIETILTALKSKNDALNVKVKFTDGSNAYWTSTEKDELVVWNVDFRDKNGLTESNRTYSKEGGPSAYQVRALCAF
jgi:hypothetical protein